MKKIELEIKTLLGAIRYTAEGSKELEVYFDEIVQGLINMGEVECALFLEGLDPNKQLNWTNVNYN